MAPACFTVGGQQSLGSPVEFAEPSPIVEGLVLTAPCEMGTTSFILDSKMQSLSEAQQLSSDLRPMGGRTGTQILTSSFSLIHPSCSRGSLGLPQIPLGYSWSGTECVLSSSHSFGL